MSRPPPRSQEPSLPQPPQAPVLKASPLKSPSKPPFQSFDDEEFDFDNIDQLIQNPAPQPAPPKEAIKTSPGPPTYSTPPPPPQTAPPPPPRPIAVGKLPGDIEKKPECIRGKPSNPTLKTPETPSVTTMSTTGITAIVNPITALKGSKTKVVIYSQLDNNSLGFEQRFLGDIANKARGDTRKPAQATTFRNPSSLFSIVLEDIINVYGVSGPTTSKPKDKGVPDKSKDEVQIANTEGRDSKGNLCLLNPVYEETDTVIENGVVAGCSDGDSEGWVFYQTTVKEPGAERVYITEQLLTGTKSNATKLVDLSPVLPDTSLAACYDGEHRWLAYQGDNNAIILRNLDRKKEAVLEDTSYTAQPKTPLGIAFVPRTAHERPRIFVYFIHRDLSLRRAFLEVDDTVDFKGYGKETLVEKSDRISQTSQLAIIPDPMCRTNHIYAIKELKGPDGLKTQQVIAFIDNYGASIQRQEEYHHRDAHHYRNRFPYPGKGFDEHYHHHGHNLGGDTLHSDHGSHYGPGGKPPKHLNPEYTTGHSHGFEHHLGHMSNMEFDVGKVNLNALLKLHLGEPRVEYNKLFYKYY